LYEKWVGIHASEFPPVGTREAIEVELPTKGPVLGLIKVVGHDLLDEVVTSVHFEGETVLDPGDGFLIVSSFGFCQHIVQFPRERAFGVTTVVPQRIIIVILSGKTTKIVQAGFGPRRPGLLFMRDHTVVIVLEHIIKGQVLEKLLAIVWFLSSKMFTKYIQIRFSQMDHVVALKRSLFLRFGILCEIDAEYQKRVTRNQSLSFMCS
jgi:hypothetical protein